MGRDTWEGLCITLKLAEADCAAGGTAEGTVFDATDREWDRNENETDPVPGIVVDLAEVLLSMKSDQRNGAFTSIISNVQPAAFNDEVFRSSVKM